ncbi:MAG: hypothetical protein A2W90_02460 [Bacteroidetes bacterium GWF2_42_66]|nr:MAG: hypothetical protein A2W92_08535 [Bacteroidetes bacterium GWA2_42_15]OFY01213.1 MAG: hypothetical protein A2W89_15945 [Bacteroidetes bacterium GWE2_42_39]OFY42056.1 MAG: hypothetical protein A2W90_02460 [Bacteroidetes bacterium GWF2_42_66]HBL77741.1 hypothetical protein [Prolixibacteraceae bacterium]HCB62870.1 hypothetical protein [Bacteroidales bacterium]
MYDFTLQQAVATVIIGLIFAVIFSTIYIIWYHAKQADAVEENKILKKKISGKVEIIQIISGKNKRLSTDNYRMKDEIIGLQETVNQQQSIINGLRDQPATVNP